MSKMVVVGVAAAFILAVGAFVFYFALCGADGD
jgi:hypothetical protein